MKTDYELIEIPVEEFAFSPRNPFRVTDDADFAKLAESVRKHGIIEPVSVRVKDGRYEIIAGQRRVRAAEAAGLRSVPAIVFDADDNEALRLACDSNFTLKGVLK